MDALKRKEKAAANADSMQKRTMEIQRQYAAGGGKDTILAAELQRSIGLYRSAQSEAGKYGLKVGEYAAAHARASKELAKANTTATCFMNLANVDDAFVQQAGITTSRTCTFSGPPKPRPATPTSRSGSTSRAPSGR